MPDPIDSIRDELATLEAAGLRRRMRPVDGPQRAQVFVDGRLAVNFSSNNYLGLADHPVLPAAAARAAAEHGFGSGASRLIVGNLAPHRALEARIAAWKKTDSALLFNSGYQANLGLVSGLVGPDDVVFSDALNHASLIDGCRLSRARVVVYPHLDLKELADQLRAIAGRRRLIVTDSVFSMDGDPAPLADLADLARRHHALLAVDEAHAVGVLGPDGVGLSAGLPVDLQMGTLGKALGAFGAYVAGAQPIIDLLSNRARSFVFTTALPVPVVAAAHAAIDWLATPDGRAARARLLDNVDRFHYALLAAGLPGPLHPSHIVPLRAADGDPRRAMAASEALLERGLFVQGIRPPTVPAGTARLRLALMATHTDEQLAALVAALVDLRPLLA
jgi:8-amino-7-oxononanoate synthase